MSQERLTAAKKLLRLFDSAPEPRRQARALHAELSRNLGWSPGQRREIDAFGAWLQTHPPLGDLKPRCRRLLAALA